MALSSAGEGERPILDNTCIEKTVGANKRERQKEVTKGKNIIVNKKMTRKKKTRQNLETYVCLLYNDLFLLNAPTQKIETVFKFYA